MIGKAQTWDCSVEDQLKKRTPAAGKCQCSAALMQFNKPNAIRFSRSAFVEILFRSWGLMFWHQQSKRSTSTSRTLKSTPVAPPPLFLRTPKLSLRHMRRKNNFGVLCPPLCGGNLLPPHSRQIGVYFSLPAPDKIASSLNAFRSFIPQQVGGCGTSPRKYRIRAGICWVSTPDSRFCIQHHCPE